MINLVQAEARQCSVTLLNRKQNDYFSRSGAKAQREITRRHSSLRLCAAA